MKTKKILTIITVFLFIPIINTAYAENTNIENNTRYVGKNSSYNYTRIQQAINHAKNGDTLIIQTGIYNETFFVNKSLKIKGEKKVIINGGYQDFIVKIQHKNVYLENLIFKNSGGYKDNAGICIKAENVTVKNCEIFRNKQGIKCEKSRDITLENCSFHHNGHGIKSVETKNIEVSKCFFRDNSIGLDYHKTENITVKHTYFTKNGLSCFFEKCTNVNFFKCRTSKNSDNHGGFFLTKNQDVIIDNCYIYHNGIGLNLNNCENIFVSNSSFIKNTHFAFKIEKNSKKIFFVGCNIKNNLRLAAYIIEDSECEIERSNIQCNYLYSIYSKKSFCNAKNNYWGRFFGPSFWFFRKNGRVKSIKCKTKVFPWLFFPVKDCGINWNPEALFTDRNNLKQKTKNIVFSSNDTDKDGCPDWWEEKYSYNPRVKNNHEVLDPDEDGLNNIEECYTDKWGSDPFRKDVFLEIDWVRVINPQDCSNKPSWSYIQQIINSYKEKNISLHVDTGDFGGGEEIHSIDNFSFSKLCDMYWDYFLHNDLENPRKGIFRYGIICNSGPDVNFPFIGWYNFDSFLVSAEKLTGKVLNADKKKVIAGASMHQLGSTLGLLSDTHHGNDNIDTLNFFSLEWFRFYRYKSCMNYFYKFKIINYSDGSNGRGDFNDWEHIDLSFFKNSVF